MAKLQTYLGCDVCGRHGGQGWRYVADRRRAVPGHWETDALGCRVQIYWQALVCCDACEAAIYESTAWQECDPDPNNWIPVRYRPPKRRPKPRPKRQWISQPAPKPRPKPPVCSTPGCGRTIDAPGGRCPQCRDQERVRKIRHAWERCSRAKKKLSPN